MKNKSKKLKDINEKVEYSLKLCIKCYVDKKESSNFKVSIASTFNSQNVKLKNVAILIANCMLNNKDDNLLKSELTSLLQKETINTFDIAELFNSIKNIINTCTLIYDCNMTILDFCTNMNVVNDVTILIFKNNFNKKITALNIRTMCNIAHEGVMFLCVICV